MNTIAANYARIKKDLANRNTGLVAVSKMQSNPSIRELYDLGQRDFGENYVQECFEKHASLPADIHWHFIGHLQSNKVKQIAPFIFLIHGVDSMKLLREIDKQAAKLDRVQSVLIQIHIAREETKFGFSYDEAAELFSSAEIKTLKNIKPEGLMGMASNTPDREIVREEFRTLKTFYDRLKREQADTCKFFQHLSMGMTADYDIALEEGSTLVRIGSALFGERKPVVK